LTDDERVQLDSMAHRRQFLGAIDAAVPRSLDGNLILDNDGTHKTPLIRHWFGELTNKQLRRGVHRSLAQLKTAIREFIAAHHARATPFVWTKTADEFLANIAGFAQCTLAFQAAPVIFSEPRGQDTSLR
jgi:putative transposase